MPREREPSIEDAYLASAADAAAEAEARAEAADAAAATIWVHLDGSPCAHVGAGIAGSYFCRRDPSRAVLTRTRYDLEQAHGFAQHPDRHPQPDHGLGASIDDTTLPDLARDAAATGRSLAVTANIYDPVGRHRRIRTVRTILDDPSKEQR